MGFPMSQKVIELEREEIINRLRKLTEEYNAKCRSCKERAEQGKVGLCDWHYSICNFEKYLEIYLFKNDDSSLPPTPKGSGYP